MKGDHRKYLNLFWATGIVALGVIFGFALTYPSRSALGNALDVFFILIISRYIALALGAIGLLLRIFKILNFRSNLLYAVAAMSNLFIAVAAIILYFFDLADRNWLFSCLPNLLLGVIIISDFLIPSTKEPNRNEI